MTDVSVVELRLLSLGGLLVTAVVTTLLTMLFAAGVAALGRRLRAAVERRHGTSNGARASGPARPRVSKPGGHGEAGRRQPARRSGSETDEEARQRIA